MADPQTTIRAAICQECGMSLTGWDEHHPIGACEMFRRTRDAGAVREAFDVQEVHHAD